MFFLSLLIVTVASSLSAAISTPYYSQIEAIIFDCDGVLVDTEHLKYLAWQKALASENISFSIEEYKPLVGHSSKNIFSMIKQSKGLEIPERIIELKNANYHSLQLQGVPPIQEMVGLVGLLSQQREHLGIKLGLASSAPKEEILQNLKQIGLENAFDVITSGHDDLDNYVDQEGKNKPKPYIYLETAKRMNIHPSKCLVFEDTAAGIQAAIEAGMVAIAVPNPFTIQQDFSKATDTIYSYPDIPSKILQTHKNCSGS